ncbi:hypothetical protein Y032_0494g2449 [Ancylostoma ceylanicum]|uniref:Uncharacterized protein n=1 Tax=Ancylostoma ceylanicum TaxID=53326 RepID=A0A016WWK7_9BILA|nr:hypothetical protein Y032_0494g2449 [Ancylostoma ceylanicum]
MNMFILSYDVSLLRLCASGTSPRVFTLVLHFIKHISIWRLALKNHAYVFLLLAQTSARYVDFHHFYSRREQSSHSCGINGGTNNISPTMVTNSRPIPQPWKTSSQTPSIGSRTSSLDCRTSMRKSSTSPSPANE